MKEYKMLPLKKRDDAYVIKPRKAIPVIMPAAEKIPYRILALSKDHKVATICANMKAEKELSVIDVNVENLGYNGVQVGDILAFAPYDTRFEKPTIICRFHQAHQCPRQLLSADEAE